MFEALDVSEGCDMHGGFLNLNLPRQLYILGILCHERICPESWVPVTSYARRTKHGKCKGKASQSSHFIVSIWLMCLELWYGIMNGSSCWILIIMKLGRRWVSCDVIGACKKSHQQGNCVTCMGFFSHCLLRIRKHILHRIQTRWWIVLRVGLRC